MRKGLLIKGCWLLLILLCSATAVHAQHRVITGKITDATTGDQLPGVNVLVKGTTSGTSSDANGDFSIEVSQADAILVFSFIGFKPFEFPTSSSQDNVAVQLEPDLVSLQEIVVVGYGTQTKSHLTGAVATANMDNFSKIPTGDAVTALQGQVAGVNVSSSSGNPAAAPTVQIRGIGTINGSAPLYVIDGIPSDASYINPSEIESINVLKDASAATIYGARGANGVILITTKRGKTGQAQITLNSFVGFHQINNDIDPASRAERNSILINSFNNAGLTPPSYTDPAVQGQYADTDWVDAFYKTAVEQKYDIGVSGGTEQVTYNFSGGFYDHNGTIVNSGMRRYNSRLNIDFNNLLHDRLKITTGIAFVRKDIRNFDDVGGAGAAGYSAIMDLYQTMPHKKIYDPTSANGYAGQDVSLGLQGAGNPVGVRALTKDRDQNDFIQLNLGADLRIAKGLTYKFILGLNSENHYNDIFYPKYDFGPTYQIETPRSFQYRSRSGQVVINNLLTYTKEINNHHLSMLVGQSSERNDFKSLGGSNLETPSSLVQSLSAGIGTRNAYGLISLNTILSYFGRVTYSFDDKYFLEASLRRDGSSRFGPENRWGTFYGASVGWAVHRENFFNVEAISELKPRFSYGVVGNQNIDDFLYQSLITTGGTALSYPLGSAPSPLAQPGATSFQLANPEIKWEETATTNIGLDLAVLQNALSFNIDFYKAKTTGMLVETRVPGSSGVQQSPITNAGDLENKGFEIGITYKNDKGALRYNINANVGSSKNKIVKLGYEGQQFIDGYVEYTNYPTTRTEVGSQIGEFYLREVGGIFQTQAEIDAYKGGDGSLLQPNAAPGDFKFIDVNGDGSLDDEDKKSFGSALPKATAGLNVNLSWKQFDLALMFYGSFGNKMYNAFKMQSYRIGFSKDLLDSWSVDNPGSENPRLIRSDPNNNYTTASNFFLEDASFVRLRNVQIGYTPKGEFFKKAGFQSARFYIGGYNLLTFTKYDGFDPGLSNFGKFARGVDRGYYPLSKSFVAGISLAF